MSFSVKGVHHIAMKAHDAAEFEAVKKFYTEVLGLPILRQWATGCMLDAGNTILELFSSGAEADDTGVLNHLAFRVDSVDEALAVVTKAGCTPFIGPKDVLIPSEPPYPARCVFVRGPMNEQIELFEER